MSSVVFFGTPAHGHINPSLPVVAELVRRGEQVIYYSTDAFRGKLEAAGACFRPYAEDYAFTSGGDLAWAAELRTWLLGRSERLLPGLLAELAANPPDYILYDALCPWGKHVAQRLARPAICSCVHFPANTRNLRAVGKLPGARWQLALGFPHFVALTWQYRQIAGRLARQHGVASPALMDFFLNAGDLTLVFTTRAFVPGSAVFDDSYKFVGPSVPPAAAPLSFSLDRFGARPLIYISFGTVFNNQPGFYRTCLEALGGSRYGVVMTIGSTVKRADLGPIPDNFEIQQFVPPSAILPKAVLFITHGGMNSMAESAFCGVPMLLVSSFGDHPLVGQRVEAAGAGRWWNPAFLTGQSLRDLVESIVGDDRYRQASRRLGQEFRAAGGYQRAVDEIFAFKARVLPA